MINGTKTSDRTIARSRHPVCHRMLSYSDRHLLSRPSCDSAHNYCYHNINRYRDLSDMEKETRFGLLTEGLLWQSMILPI